MVCDLKIDNSTKPYINGSACSFSFCMYRRRTRRRERREFYQRIRIGDTPNKAFEH